MPLSDAEPFNATDGSTRSDVRFVGERARAPAYKYRCKLESLQVGQAASPGLGRLSMHTCPLRSVSLVDGSRLARRRYPAPCSTAAQ